METQPQKISYYLLGADWSSGNQTERFLESNIWENGFEENEHGFGDKVNGIKEGDIVAIKAFNRKFQHRIYLKGIGTVIRNYNNGIKLDVNWERPHNSPVQKIDDLEGRYNLTIHIMENQHDINKIFLSQNKMQGNEQDFDSNGHNLNTILYGPPGTGKTFNTINKALEIVDPDFYALNNTPEKRNKLTDRFKELMFNYDTDEGQIGFITFHQSMSYEDFIEGIKPIKPELTNNIALYDVEDGLFKRLCSAAQSKEGNFNEKIEWLKNKCSELENKPPIKVVTKGTTFSFSYRGGTTFVVKPESSQNEVTDYRASIENIRKIYEGGLRKEVYNPTYVVGVLQYLYENGLNKYEEIKDASRKPYVLIIDEINRGNISQIFGELITLIEEDKRLGMDESLEVTLPNSKERFGVPPNLYIIGTMNTADRSVEALDTALRRRFSFEELMPDPELLKDVKVGAIAAKDILIKINERIEVLLDRDHTIGHSFFLKLKSQDDLRSAFRDNIIPLLQEYFYGDYGKIGLVLGKGFVEEKKQEKGKFADIHYDGKEEFMSVKYKLKAIRDDFPILEAVTELLVDK